MFYVFPKVIKPDVCERIVSEYKESNLKKASVLNLDKTQREDPSGRRANIHFITDKDNEATTIAWHFLREANKIQFNYDIEYFQPAQFAEYRAKEGGFQDWHQDDSAVYGTEMWDGIRKLSLSLILSDPNTFEGGELQFYNGGKSLDDMHEVTGEQIQSDIKAQGSIIVFDSRDWHRVSPMVSGTRYSLVCWCVGPNFK